MELVAPVEEGDRCILSKLRGVVVGLAMRPELDVDEVLRMNLAHSAIVPRSKAVLGTPEPETPLRTALMES